MEFKLERLSSFDQKTLSINLKNDDEGCKFPVKDIEAVYLDCVSGTFMKWHIAIYFNRGEGKILTWGNRQKGSGEIFIIEDGNEETIMKLVKYYNS